MKDTPESAKLARDSNGVADKQMTTNNARKPGRPRNPNAKSRDTVRYRSWTGYLIRDAVAEAGYELERTNLDGSRDGRDLSDLIGDLLTSWIVERKKTRSQVSQSRPVNALS